MSEVHFRFSPNILVRLGEELNQGTDQSILELIKNSYDADATICTVELKNTENVGGSITVTDDGNGMSAQNIKDSWLVLGKSSKSHLQTTDLGRTPSGSKGLGRLAALRLGTTVNLESKLEKRAKSSNLYVEWDKFESAQTVEDVGLVISDKKTDLKKGTITTLSNLRSAIRTEDLKKLARAVLLLTDPFEDKKSGFQVKLKSPEFDEIDKLLQQKYFDLSEFHLIASVTPDGLATAKIVDWRGELLQEASHMDLIHKSNEPLYKSPACTLDFWAFLLKADSFGSGRGGSLKDVREWLKHFGGVHVYSDNVRVSPYGAPGDDWLGINLSRTKNPEERPSTNNSIGRVSLNNKGKYQVTQKTDRSGFIEDDAFLEMKRFVTDALEWMARWRMQLAEKRRQGDRIAAPQVAKEEKEKFEDVLQEAPKQIRNKISAAFKSYAKSRDRESELLRKEIQLYRTLSTAGITAATFAHESHGNPLKVISLSVNALDSRFTNLAKERDLHIVTLALAKIRKSLDALAVLGSATLSLIRSNKRRVGRVEVNKVILEVHRLMLPFLEARATKVELRLCTGNPFLRCSEAALESVITNLINNALNVFRSAHSDECIIKITTKTESGVCEITVCDTGPGIKGLSLSEIWLPGITSNPDGTGLGLTIVKDTVKDLGGDVSVIAQGELGGAEFKIALPVLGV
ncbi:histidine kinase [Pseudomonas plecoglossicida]|uniref:histidine kinase n=1 Tax=Pseudomonas plecoglossicida TaxID=70775 RepID=A0A2R7UN72_PSEDL|nr:sensor histidine kinase [Pseudomonas plecoglossicida]PTU53386.1 histidine kinase [Pseudomonas plecoglossicida]